MPRMRHDLPINVASRCVSLLHSSEIPSPPYLARLIYYIFAFYFIPLWSVVLSRLLTAARVKVGACTCIPRTGRARAVLHFRRIEPRVGESNLEIKVGRTETAPISLGEDAQRAAVRRVERTREECELQPPGAVVRTKRTMGGREGKYFLCEASRRNAVRR